MSDSASAVFDFLREATDLGWHCLLRLCQDRAIRQADGTPARLGRWMRARPGGADHRPAGARRGAPAHRAPAAGLGARAALGAAQWAGAGRPAGVGLGPALLGEELAWPLPDAATAPQSARWYGWRWLIEDSHKCLKTGCRLEARQLTAGHRLLALLGLVAVVAVRLLRLHLLRRHAPDTPASTTVPQEVLAVLAGSLPVCPEALTVAQFWRGVARLGGFIGRASAGDPGWQTLWAGWHRLQDRLWGFHCAQAP